MTLYLSFLQAWWASYAKDQRGLQVLWKHGGNTSLAAGISDCPVALSHIPKELPKATSYKLHILERQKKKNILKQILKWLSGNSTSSSPVLLKHGAGFIQALHNDSGCFISSFSWGLNVPAGTALAPSLWSTAPFVPVWACDWTCCELPTTQEWPETMRLFLTD